MAYDEALAHRLRDLLAKEKGVSAKEMFGGIAFLIDGKMFVGVVKDELMARVGKERHAELIKRLGARTMDFTGRPMIGYIFVTSKGFKAAKDLKFWVQTSLEFTKTVKKKPAPKKKIAVR